MAEFLAKREAGELSEDQSTLFLARLDELWWSLSEAEQDEFERME